jgi:hypothetical protein
MKPAVSALNDWLKTIIVHKSFNYLRISKSNAHYATIELGVAQQYNYVSNNYEDRTIATIDLCVDEINGKLTNVVKFRLDTPTGLVQSSNSYYSKIQTYQNITLKNLIEFVDFFSSLYRNRQDSLFHLYNIPNYNNMGFTHNYKPFNGSFEQYFKKHQKEYNKFLEYREILFNFLDKKSKINIKKKRC